jgi:tetratricopeptide (TPR) repeat protein
LAPDVLAAFLKKATELHSAGRLEEAARFYQHVQDCNPDALAAPYFHAMIDIELGQLESALQRLRVLLRRDPNSLEAQVALAYVYRQLDRWQQSADAYRRALVLKPDAVQARFHLGDALEVLGQIPAAIALYRELAGDERTRIRALGRISIIQPAAITDDELAEIESELDAQKLEGSARIVALFALAGVLERKKRYDDAFAAYTEGNRLKRQAIENAKDRPRPISIEPPEARVLTDPPEEVARRHAEQVASAKRLFTTEFISRNAGGGHDNNAPIFIVGMPRSGTTLLEQILASHPKVTGLGESSALWRTVGGAFPYRQGENVEVSPDHFRTLADAYLAQQRARGWDNTPRFIDKMLGNYMMIGMIHLMFPHASILHSVRDPVDTCFSCFRQLFRTGNETTYDLRDVGAQYCRYREMMAHWESVLPGRVINVWHEELVDEPERITRWLVNECCGLKWDDSCMRFFESRRPVRTASIAQVRQPIFKTSIERWRCYERHLGPLFEALGQYAPKEFRKLPANDS